MTTDPYHNPTRPKLTFVQRLEPKLLIAIIAIEFGTFIMVTSIMLATRQSPYLIALIAALLTLPIALIAASHLRITLLDDRLRWAFVPFWRSHIPYTDIESVEYHGIKINPMGQFAGWGPKYAVTAPKGHKREFGLIAQAGTGIRITRLNDKRPVLISTSEPERLAAELLERVVAAAPNQAAGRTP